MLCVQLANSIGSSYHVDLLYLLLLIEPFDYLTLVEKAITKQHALSTRTEPSQVKWLMINPVSYAIIAINKSIKNTYMLNV